MPLSDILASEQQALLLLCLPDLDDKKISHLKNLLEEISDWNKFINLLNQHGIIALANHKLNSSGLTKLLPDREREILYKSYLKSLARNSAIFSLFQKVSDIALEGGIKIIPLKGLLLENLIYGNIGLRQMNDLDILVAPEDAIKLRNLLLKKGFESIPFTSPIHSYFLHSYGKHMPEMYYKGLNVEIHFRLFRDRHNEFTREMIRLSTDPYPGGNKVTFIPPPEHNFLYLVKHLLWHERAGSSQLRLYCDLIFLINKYKNQILNQQLFDLAKKYDMEDKLINILLITNKYFGIPVDYKGYLPEKLNRRFLEFLIKPRNNRPEEGVKEEPFKDQLRNIEGFFHKILFAIGMFIPSLTFMKWRYKTRNRFTALLYYPKRWLDFFRKIF